MNGLHLIADLHDCADGGTSSLLLDAIALQGFCAAVCVRHQLRIVGQVFHTFSDAKGAPAGVTGALVLAESHLAIHTWPEASGVTLDLYVCNFSADNSAAARAAFKEVIAAFSPGRVEQKEIVRGQLQT